MKPSFLTSLIIERTVITRHSSESNLPCLTCVFLRKLSNPTELPKPKMDQGSEERQAMGRLVKLGQLYDVRQDKVLVSILLDTLRSK